MLFRVWYSIEWKHRSYSIGVCTEVCGIEAIRNLKIVHANLVITQIERLTQINRKYTVGPMATSATINIDNRLHVLYFIRREHSQLMGSYVAQT